LVPSLSTNQYEIIADGYHLYVDPNLPYSLKGAKKTTNTEKYYFKVDTFKNNILTINANTNDGTRFVTYLNDNNFYALGSPVNTYLLSSTPLGDQFIYDYIPNNPWVTYYMDYYNSQKSKNTTINKILNDTKINYLIDFPYVNAAKTNKAYINISNLKTGYTPQGYPVPIDNFYKKELTLTKPELEAIALAFGLDPLVFKGELITFSL
jgi:hypothetical protein